MTKSETTFDIIGFRAALDSTRIARDITWKQVAEESGVSPSTLTRMEHHGKYYRVFVHPKEDKEAIRQIAFVDSWGAALGATRNHPWIARADKRNTGDQHMSEHIINIGPGQMDDDAIARLKAIWPDNNVHVGERIFTLDSSYVYLGDVKYYYEKTLPKVKFITDKGIALKNWEELSEQTISDLGTNYAPFINFPEEFNEMLEEFDFLLNQIRMDPA